MTERTSIITAECPDASSIFGEALYANEVIVSQYDGETIHGQYIIRSKVSPPMAIDYSKPANLFPIEIEFTGTDGTNWKVDFPRAMWDAIDNGVRQMLAEHFYRAPQSELKNERMQDKTERSPTEVTA